MERKRLLDFYNNPRKGIFYNMWNNAKLFEVWNEIFTDASEVNHSEELDMDYLLNSSGLKTMSVLIETLYKGYVVDDLGDYVITKWGEKVTYDYIRNEIDNNLINSIIVARFYKKWLELAKTMNITIDALNPYQMTVTDKVGVTGNYTSSDERNIGGSSNNDTTSNGSNSRNDSTYGFNSTTAVPTDDTEGSNENEIHSASGYGEQNKGSSTSTRKSDTERSITRKGNIGNKSAMQLIEEKREMLKYQVLLEIYKDLDSVLTRSKYII